MLCLWRWSHWFWTSFVWGINQVKFVEYRSSWKVVPPFLLLRPDSIAVRRHSTVNIVNQQSKHKEAVFLNNRKENRFFFCAFTGCCYLTEDISYELYGEKTTLECVTYFALLACPFYELWLERLIVGLDGRTGGGALILYYQRSKGWSTRKKLKWSIRKLWRWTKKIVKRAIFLPGRNE